MSYGTSLPYTYRRAAICVGRVIKGEKRADLPVMQPTKYDLVLNIKTAKAPGLNIGTATRTRRRGDRIGAVFAALHMSAFGTKRTFHG